MKMHRYVGILGVVSPLMLAFACSDGDALETIEPAVGVSSGHLDVRLEGSDGVTGFLFEVLKPDGSLVAKRYVALEEETLAPELVGEDFGPGHRFADGLFVLPPGKYVVRATPMDSGDDPSDICAPASSKVVVHEGLTSEVVLVSSCKGRDNGAVDVVAVTNHPPLITDLVLRDSKFALTCECVAATVTAEDPDGDELSYQWQLVTTPTGASYDMTPSGRTLHFKSHTQGTYEFRVKVCDDVNPALCTSLTFPIHVKNPSDAGAPNPCMVSPPTKLDLVFAIDTTGSMYEHITEVRNSILPIVSQLAAKVADYRVAVVDFRDFPQTPYGMPYDYPYQADLDFTKDAGAIQAAVNGLSISGGMDAPESVYTALISSIHNEDMSPWRPDAAKAILLMGDGPAHDPEPFTNFVLKDVIDAAQFKGGDPGTGGPVSVFTIAASNGGTKQSFKDIADATGGQFYDAPNPSDAVPAVIEAISSLSVEKMCDAHGPI